MSAHTPGPWTLETVPTSIGSCHKIGPFPSGRLASGTYACVYADGIRIGVDDNIPMAVELLANARLIAAAPDLLAALQQLVAATWGLAPATSADGCYTDDPKERDARAAIAKATGEAP